MNITAEGKLIGRRCCNVETNNPQKKKKKNQLGVKYEWVDLSNPNASNPNASNQNTSNPNASNPNTSNPNALNDSLKL